MPLQILAKIPVPNSLLSWSTVPLVSAQGAQMFLQLPPRHLGAVCRGVRPQLAQHDDDVGREHVLKASGLRQKAPSEWHYFTRKMKKHKHHIDINIVEDHTTISNEGNTTARKKQVTFSWDWKLLLVAPPKGETHRQQNCRRLAVGKVQRRNVRVKV